MQKFGFTLQNSTFIRRPQVSGKFPLIAFLLFADSEKLGDLEENVVGNLQRRVAFLEREMMLIKQGFGERVKSTFGKGVEEQDKMEYKRLITEYRKFKTNNVKHFRFNSAANVNAFGEYYLVK